MKLIIISTVKEDQQQLNINTLLKYNKRFKSIVIINSFLSLEYAKRENEKKTNDYNKNKLIWNN